MLQNDINRNADCCYRFCRPIVLEASTSANYIRFAPVLLGALLMRALHVVFYCETISCALATRAAPRLLCSYAWPSSEICCAGGRPPCTENAARNCRVVRSRPSVCSEIPHLLRPWVFLHCKRGFCDGLGHCVREVAQYTVEYNGFTMLN